MGIRVVAERWDEAGQTPRHVASVYGVYVGLDEQGRPRPIPSEVCESADDERRYREAVIRRQARLARREAILRLRASKQE